MVCTALLLFFTQRKSLWVTSDSCFLSSENYCARVYPALFPLLSLKTSFWRGWCEALVSFTLFSSLLQMAKSKSCSWVWLVLPWGYTKLNWALCQMMFALLVSSQLYGSSLKRVFGRCEAWGKGRWFFLIRPLSMFGCKVMKTVQDEPGKGTGRWKPSARRSQPGLRGGENNLSREVCREEFASYPQ